MLISMLPLVVLFEVSLLLARAFGTPPEGAASGEAAEEPS
jgi:Sec-independent protein secretion pathway component TatC